MKDVPPRVEENLGIRSPEDEAIDRKLRIFAIANLRPPFRHLRLYARRGCLLYTRMKSGQRIAIARRSLAAVALACHAM